jgi:kynurenine formamidase
VPFCLINVAKKSSANYLCSVEDIKSYERSYGKITKNAFVLIHTGWGKHWSNPKRYRNHLQFPSLAKEAALLLLEREIAGIGIDTLSPDTGESGYPVHHILLGAGKYIIENVANSETLPPRGGFIVGLPLPIVKGTEAPLRLLALIPRETLDE